MSAIEEKYFAAANSREGFVSYFGEIFRGLSRLYIIKGGPGTGKSRFMRQAAEEAEGRGYRVEYYYCSADDLSLDGIIIRGIEVGIIDGTAPHTREPELAGALDDIVNIGAFWDSDMLRSRQDEIRALTEKKAKLYASVYDLLAAAGRVEASARSVVSSALDSEKLGGSVSRILRGVKASGEGSEDIRITSCIGMNGEVRFPTLERFAKHRCLVRDIAGSGSFFLHALHLAALAAHLHVTVSYSPLDPQVEDGLYIRECDTAYILTDTVREDSRSMTREDDRTINMARFLDSNLLREHRASLRFLRRCSTALKDEAAAYFTQIKEAHFAIEEIYSAAMNFEAKEAFTDTLIQKIFS